MLTAAHAAQQPESVAVPCAAVRHRRMLARCGRACAAFEARLKCAVRHSSTVRARQRSCPQIAKPLQSALRLHVGVLVRCRPRDGSRCRKVGVAKPCRALQRPLRACARSRLCGVPMSVRRCRKVPVSSMCSAVELCFRVCIACARARVWLCAAQVLPDGPGATGRGSLCADLWDGGPALARIDPPAIGSLFTKLLLLQLY